MTTETPADDTLDARRYRWLRRRLIEPSVSLSATPKMTEAAAQALDRECDKGLGIRAAKRERQRTRRAEKADPVQAQLRKFLDAAAGEGFCLDGVDAAELYAALFPRDYAEGKAA